jgi:hypothetical protein
VLSTSALRTGTRTRRRIPAVSLNLYFVALIAGVSVYYLFLLSNGTFQILAPELLDKVFDNILVHLLRGEFTVDRNAIDYVAVTHKGSAYTYFGVFPAILRLLAMPFVDVARCGTWECRWTCALPSSPLHRSLTPLLSRDAAAASPSVETADGWALRPR